MLCIVLFFIRNLHRRDPNRRSQWFIQRLRHCIVPDIAKTAAFLDTLLKFLYNEYGGAVRSVLQHANANSIQTAYDGLGRLSTRKVYVNGSAYTTAYAYAPGAESGQTTALVQEITQPGENHSYAYDNAGNIVSATRNGITTTYAYDALGQLIRVNDPNDGTWTYEYDCGGNILNKKQYAYTTGTPGTVQQIVSYAYGDADWKDKLTRYNGVDIAYDAIGNPIQDGVWTYTWENGRQLRRMACDATIAEFVYNADGLRVQKTVNGVATNYTLHGKNIVHMIKGNAELHFWYDAQNRPAIVEFNGTKYGYLYNLQGDVIGLIDSANTEVVKYTYDAWGKPLSVTGSLANTIGYYNPFRYRGYVYDVETGLYYLRSRYYNPSWGRFVNADNFVKNSLFAYCLNNPIVNCDENGSSEVFQFAAMGIGNVVCASLYGGGGYVPYIFEQNNISLPSVPCEDPLPDFIAELRSYNIGGKLIHSGISGAAGAAAGHLLAFGLATAGLAGVAAVSITAAGICFLGELVGTIIENDMKPDGCLNGIADNSHPMASVKNGIIGGLLTAVPSYLPIDSELYKYGMDAVSFILEKLLDKLIKLE